MSLVRKTVAIVRETVSEFMEDDCLTMGAAIAYFALLSLPALIASLFVLAGVVFGDEVVRGAMLAQASELMGEEGAGLFSTMLEERGGPNGGSIAGQIVGFVALFVGATGAFSQLQQALNRAWDVEPDPKRNAIKDFVGKRLLSFGMLLTIVFLLAVSLVLNAVVRIAADQLSQLLSEAGWIVLQVAEVGLPLLLFSLLFMAMFKVLPDARIAWRDVAVGGFVTAVLFVIGNQLIGLYLGNASVGEAYGAAGSIVVVLVWIFYTAVLVLAGAEFTQVWARREGKEIQPDDGAVLIVRETREVHPRERAPAAHPAANPRAPQPRSGIND